MGWGWGGEGCRGVDGRGAVGMTGRAQWDGCAVAIAGSWYTWPGHVGVKPVHSGFVEKNAIGQGGVGQVWSGKDI